MKVSADPSYNLHEKVGRQVVSRLKRGSEWMTEATKTISECLSVESIRKGTSWDYVKDVTGSITKVIATLGVSAGNGHQEWPMLRLNPSFWKIVSPRSQSFSKTALRGEGRTQGGHIQCGLAIALLQRDQVRFS